MFLWQKSEADLERSRASGRYNLRRRKEEAVTKSAQRQELEKKVVELLAVGKRSATPKTTELDFGGRIGKGSWHGGYFTKQDC